jgi:hypothetical protein
MEWDRREKGARGRCEGNSANASHLRKLARVDCGRCCAAGGATGSRVLLGKLAGESGPRQSDAPLPTRITGPRRGPTTREYPAGAAHRAPDPRGQTTAARTTRHHARTRNRFARSAGTGCAGGGAALEASAELRICDCRLEGTERPKREERPRLPVRAVPAASTKPPLVW